MHFQYSILGFPKPDIDHLIKVMNSQPGVINLSPNYSELNRNHAELIVSLLQRNSNQCTFFAFLMDFGWKVIASYHRILPDLLNQVKG